MDRYPLEWGWHVPPSSRRGDAPAWKPRATLLGGADFDSFAGDDDASGPPVQLAELSDEQFDNELHFRTVTPQQTDRRFSQPGSVSNKAWEVEMHLTKPSQKGGWIVQKVIHTTPGGKSFAYWEAWRVKPGQTRTERSVERRGEPDDTFMLRKGASPGTRRLESEARFYEGLELPPAFRKFNPEVPEAGELPATPTRPDFWSDTARRAKKRTWEATK